MTSNSALRIALLLFLALLLGERVLAHPGHYPHAATTTGSDEHPVTTIRGDVPTVENSDTARQQAFFTCELLTDVALRCPTASQRDFIRFAEGEHLIVNQSPGAPAIADRHADRKRVYEKLTHEIATLRLDWREAGATLAGGQSLQLTKGLEGGLLLDVLNGTTQAVDVAAWQTDYKSGESKRYTVLPGASQPVFLQVHCENIDVDHIELVLATENGEQVTLECAVTIVEPATIRGRLLDGDTGEVWPGRVYAEGSDHQFRRGTRYAKNETLSQKQLLQFWNLGKYYQLPFFYSDGSFEVKVAPGEVEIALERGFEHEIVREKLSVDPGEVRQVDLTSRRFYDMQSRGWVSGDTHVHWVINQWNVDLPLELLAMVQRAEDLRVANNLTLLQRGPSKAFINPQQAPMGTVKEFSDDDYHIEMGEEYRNEDLYGHLCFLNLDWLVLPIGTGSIIAGPDALDYPINKTAILACREQGGISIEAHGLGGNKDVPVNVIHGFTDSLDQIDPEEYYRFLECGFKLPLTNGSDHPARVAGCARAYVKIDGEFTYEKWIEGIRKCRTFTTSGPLLELSVNGADIGDTLEATADESLEIVVRAQARHPLGKVEIVSNSEVLASEQFDDRQGELRITVPAKESRWIVARCGPEDDFNAIHGPDIAHTSAIYVNVDGRPRVVPEAAEVWIGRMRQHLHDIRAKGHFLTDYQEQEALEYVEQGIDRYEALVAQGTDQQPEKGPAPSTASPASADEDVKKIVLIPTKLDHPWATHMYRNGCELLAACLNNHPNVEAVVSPDDDWPADPAVLDGVDSIVFYSRPAADLLLNEQRHDEVKRLMDSGVGLVAIHWSTGTTDDKYGPDFLNLLGGWFSFAHSGLKVDRLPLQQVKPESPVCTGWDPFTLRDEFYLNLKFHERAEPVLQVKVDDVDQTVAWTYQRDGEHDGRSFGTTLAHFHDNFTNDNFRRAIVNGILWTAHVEVPKTGADVELPDEKLELPPPPAAAEPAQTPWPQVERVDGQPLLLQAKRLAEALDYIGNPLPDAVKQQLADLANKSDSDAIAQKLQELLDPLCIAAVDIENKKMSAVAVGRKVELVEQGWRSYLVKVCNRDSLTTRLHVESPNARPLPHAKAEDVKSRWMGLTTFDGRPMRATLSGLELEYRVIQIYSRDAGENNATVEFSIDADSSSPGRMIREWRFDQDVDGWQPLNQVKLETKDGSLYVEGLGSDPFIGTEVGNVSGDLLLRFWAKAEEDGVGQVFFWTEEQPEPDPNKAVTFPLIPGSAQQYEAPIKVEGVLAGVRIDTNVKASNMRIDWIDLSYAHRRGETWTSVPLKFEAKPAYPVTIRVEDEFPDSAMAAFVVRDQLGRIYPEQSKRLAPDLFFQPQVYRATGETITLPPGNYEVRSWRGPESLPAEQKLVVDDKPAELTYEVKRWIDPSKQGWWSGDHHIHAAGCMHYQNPTQGVRPEDMIRQIMGEDLHVGCCLTWGPCFDFQKRFFSGEDQDLTSYPYIVRYDVEVSGFGSHASGHLNLLRLKEQIYPGGESKDHWPTLGLNTLKWAKGQGAICGTAHSAAGLTRYVGALPEEAGPHGLPHYNIPAFDGIGANEYVVDVTHEVAGEDGKPVPAVDFIATMNTPRGDEWNMWYHTLNCGFRVRASGETDFPCMSGERVGIGRVYVKVEGNLNYPDWIQGIQDGRSYVSDARAHLMNLRAETVDGLTLELGTDGSELALDKPQQVRFFADCAALEDLADFESEEAPNVEVELIVNGYPVDVKQLRADGRITPIEFAAEVSASSWVALRIHPHAHTNPIFVLVGGKPIRASKASAEWCLQGVEQCWKQKESTYAAAEFAAAVEAYQHARETYERIREETQQ